MENEIIRKDFLKKLTSYKDQKDVIKVLTGIRRCGKSTLLRQYRGCLIDSGIPEERIIYINMESMSNDRFKNADVLYEHIIDSSENETLYVMIDEIQNINGWERLVSSIMTDIDADIYITGSNAYLLSTELSTLLTGRSVPIRILPLSFNEFCELGQSDDMAKKSENFERYVRLGGMPFIRPSYDEDTIFERLEEVKSDIILKDICNRKKTINSTGLRKTIDYMFSDIGNSISAETISKELKISTSTANDYLKLIADSLLFNEVKRYDLKRKNVLKTNGKYYCTDLGMRNTQPIRSGRDYGKVYENIVYLELVRRGYRVFVGKMNDLEIDFIAIRNNVTEYYQVCTTISDENVYQREMKPFRSIVLNGSKYLIVMDPVVYHDDDGVKVINLIDWLCSSSIS